MLNRIARYDRVRTAVGAVVMDALIESNMTVDDLANRTDLPRQVLAGTATGDSVPRFDVLLAVEAALGYPPGRLVSQAVERLARNDWPITY